jgi:indolepyruvate ferredoxin oxidoreductase alpha subunit
MVGLALEISEQFDTPVMLRLTTRISHSDTVVELGERTAVEPDAPSAYQIDRLKYVMVPGNARRRHPVIEERLEKIAQYANTWSGNRVEMGDTRLGVIANGVAYQYAREVFGEASFLKLGMTYPLPETLIREFAAQVDRLIVVEELDPFIEGEIRLMGIPVEGKSFLPLCGELNPTIVRSGAIAAGLLPPVPQAATQRTAESTAEQAPTLPARPPLLCPGCPHRGVFVVTNKLKLVVNGDIGCYTLGFLPPLSALHTCGCMGASIGVAHGVSKAEIAQKHVAVIGDSTFFHTGIPALLNVAYNQSDTVVLILDNRTTAMTGHQENPGTGQTLMGQPTYAVDLEVLARSMGIERVHTVDSYNLSEVEAALRDCLEAEGPAVIVAKRACALLPEARREWKPLTVDAEACNGCGRCFRVGCPAIVRSDEIDERTKRAKARIDPLLCTGCEICAQVCPQQAIAGRADRTPQHANESEVE